MHRAPSSFRGSLRELYEQHIQTILPTQEQTERFREWMCHYAEESAPGRAGVPGSEGPIFPACTVAGADRRRVYLTADQTRIAPADNSPAWVVHALCCQANCAIGPIFAG